MGSHTQEHDFVVRCRDGAKHHNADALSRLPADSSADYSGARLDDEEPAAMSVLWDEDEVPGKAFALAYSPVEHGAESAVLHVCHCS